MANTTIWIGVLLALVGIIGYVASGMVSPTALIPAGFGLVLIILGFLARDESKRKHAMHGAAVVGLVGFLGSVNGFVGVARMMAGQEVARPMATVAQAAMALITLVFVWLCVRSFIQARRARQGA